METFEHADAVYLLTTEHAAAVYLLTTEHGAAVYLLTTEHGDAVLDPTGTRYMNSPAEASTSCLAEIL